MVKNSKPAKDDSPKYAYQDGGAFVRPITTVRRMKNYNVSQNELLILTILNSAMTFLLAIGSALLLFGIDLYFGAVIEGILTEEARVLIKMTQPTCFLVAGISYILAFVSWRSRQSILNTIIRETKELTD